VLLEIPREQQACHQALIVGRDEPQFGFVVDRIEHVAALRRSELVASAVTAHQELISGLNPDGLIVLDGEKLIDCPDLFIDDLD
jgi:chemotaxis signal transduction protein